MLDTKGPEIRTGLLEGGKDIELLKDQELEISKLNIIIYIFLATDYSFKGNSEKIACSYEQLPKSVKIGGKILVADGNIVCEVLEIKKTSIIVRVLNNSNLGEKKNMNLPNCKVDLPTLTDKDEDDIVNFGLKEGIDMIAASFVRTAEDVNYIRDVLGPRGAHIKIISKIENHEGIENYEEILEASDGIMVARGDLGMELPVEKVFIAQKYMIDRCNVAGKPVITATQMLESMIKNPRPTRAEATDVANAVLDGTDCVMLSGETAGGSHPLAAVSIMSKLCVEAESVINYENAFSLITKYTAKPISTKEAVCSAAVRTSQDINASLIVVITESGATARLVAKYKPTQIILALCMSSSVIRQLNITRGVITLKIPSFLGTDNLINDAMKYATDSGYCKKGDNVVCLLGQNEEAPEYVNIMKITTI
jgi:pyruvate kinase